MEITKTSTKRKSLTFDDKKFLVSLMKKPTRSGKAKPIRHISIEYGVSRNTLYKLLNAYDEDGDLGLVSKKRGEYLKKSDSSELLIKIKEIALHHPNYAADKISEALKKFNFSFSAPTIQKILKQINLSREEERYAVAESAILKTPGKFTDSQISLVCKYNPCFADRIISNRYDGHGIYVDAIPIERYFNNGPAYILIAIEMYSLYTFAEISSEINHSIARDFQREAARQFQQITNQKRIRIFDDGRWPFNYMYFTNHPNSDIQFSYFSENSLGSKVPGVYKFIADKIRKEFIPKAKLNSLSSAGKINEMLELWIGNLNNSPGPITYPCFGLRPLEAIKKQLI